MSAGTLNCPMCGAAAATDSTRCEHCGARLATVACPSCYGMIFVGSKYCCHCGARADRTELDAGVERQCPRCRVPMQTVTVGTVQLCECPLCAGVWADNACVERICADQESQVSILGAAAMVPPNASVQLESKIQYVPCPTCGELMNRVNFANCSSVVVDVCKAHGVWFDPDELRQIVEFIRSGGLLKAREREIAELEERRRRALGEAAAVREGAAHERADWPDAISSVGSVIRFLRGKPE